MHSLTVTTVICLFTITAAASSRASHELEELLRLADARRQEYIEAFRDLVAVETRLTEVIEQHGRTECQRTLVSDFLVYQSALDHRLVADERAWRHSGMIPALRDERRVRQCPVFTSKGRRA